MLLGQHALLESFHTLASPDIPVKLLGYFVLLTVTSPPQATPFQRQWLGGLPLGLEPLLTSGGVLKVCYNFYMNTTHAPMEYQRDEHRVHLIVYHLIWCPKRRKSVLVGALARRCQELIEQKCKERGWQVLTLAIQPDHIHLFVRVWPSDSAAQVVKECKGVSSFVLRKEFPTLKSVPSLWTRSYFASTAGKVSQETIQRYIAAQKGR